MTVWVVCLKHGAKYSAEYVNKLRNMVARHLTTPHQFVCFTDDTLGVDPQVECRGLPVFPISGWWWKPYIFKAGHFPAGDTVLYIDLDMVIVSNLDKLLDFSPGNFVGLEDVSRVFGLAQPKLGSAVMRWQAGECSDIWDYLFHTPSITKNFAGDQDYIWSLYKEKIEFFPRSWISSYKWEIRNRVELVRVGQCWKFNKVRNPEIPVDTAILAFHGTPSIPDVKDPVIIDNWR